MKWIVLVSRMLFRNKRRTFLTMVSVGLALFIFTTLQTVLNALQINIGSGLGETRVAVIEKNGGPRVQLPATYQSQLEKVNHVVAATPTEYSVLRVGETDNTFYIAIVVEPETFKVVYASQLQNITEGSYDDFMKTKNGVLVGRQIMTAYGWKVGDQIQMSSLLDRVTFDLIISGVMENKDGRNAALETQVRLQRAYYDEKVNPSGKANVYWLRLDSPASVSNVMNTVTDLFKSAPKQVSVQTENSMLARFSSFTATIQLVMQIISIVVLFTILIVAANTIALSMRERRKEIAVMKAFGYTERRVLGLALLEAMMTSLVGGVVGTVAAFTLFNASGLTLSLGLTFDFHVTPQIVALGSAVSLVLGVLSGLIPAYNAARVSVIKTLRSV